LAAFAIFPHVPKCQVTVPECQAKPYQRTLLQGCARVKRSLSPRRMSKIARQARLSNNSEQAERKARESLADDRELPGGSTWTWLVLAPVQRMPVIAARSARLGRCSR